ncbi:MAG: beta-ketoacyl-[acyl-carrier-protein] synthase II, partial [Defluviitaleaceae bacterium]|nr:beta-ketoacyl-[acyl-carrier-protein] synthase II [Defluviitaleaceae bacterium]
MKRVVITGLGCISPVGNNIADFWISLTQGKHGFAEITKFDASGMKAKIAAEVKNFVPENFIEKSEIKRTELFCQYAIAAAAEAMDDSGLANTVSPERFGVYVGSGIGGLGTMVAQTEVMFNRGPERISPFLIPMMIANMASGLIAMRHNARGVNLPVISACATATHAIGEAFRAVKHGYADAILAGGSEASINMLGIGAFTTAMALSA